MVLAIVTVDGGQVLQVSQIKRYDYLDLPSSSISNDNLTDLYEEDKLRKADYQNQHTFGVNFVRRALRSKPNNYCITSSWVIFFPIIAFQFNSVHSFISFLPNNDLQNQVLSSFGASLVVEKPVRRELFSMYIDNVDLSYKARGNLRSLEFNVMDLQVDNYSETMIYPVMLRSTKKEIHKSINFEDNIEYTAEGYNVSDSAEDKLNSQTGALFSRNKC